MGSRRICTSNARVSKGGSAGSAAFVGVIVRPGSAPEDRESIEEAAVSKQRAYLR